jgi:glucose/arabinose dehydrogenase
VEDFATGWLKNQQAWGRPVDVAVGADGALYVSDDKANIIYRVSYKNK